MKALTFDKMVQLCEASEKQLSDSIEYLGRKLGDGEWIREGIERGHYRAEVATVDGKESYLAVFHISDQGVLVVNAFSCLGGGDCGATMVDTVKALAAKYGCFEIECMTLRAGMAKTLLNAGFEPIGIALSLKLK